MGEWKNRAQIALIAACMVIVTAGGLWWWAYSEKHPSTDDAYVGGNIVPISPQVSGPVVKVYVENNQLVAKGQPLFDIDPRLFDLAVADARALFDRATDVAGVSAANVTAAAAVVAERQATLQNAQAAYSRADDLFKSGTTARSVLDDAEEKLREARAGLDEAQANLVKARKELGKRGKENAQVRAAAAALQRAEINRSYAQALAPVSGWVANLDLQPGVAAQSNVALFAIVKQAPRWVDANFRETDIARIRPGQPAEITVDMYPSLKLKGIVESISGGSGAVFSLLPAENATGNWVKVTQRFTVRISIPKLPKDPSMPLRLGASAWVRIDTTGKIE